MHRAVNAVRLESYVMVFPFEICFMRLALCNNIRDLKQSGRQLPGRLRLKNESLPLIRILKMAASVYRLIRRHTSTSG